VPEKRGKGRKRRSHWKGKDRIREEEDSLARTSSPPLKVRRCIKDVEIKTLRKRAEEGGLQS